MNEEEVVAILDERENIIGTKRRQDLTDSDCWRVICIWVENDKGQVLMQQRSQDRKINPGLWTCAVVGTVTGSDSYDSTAYREAEEEIGLTGHTLTPIKRLHMRSSFGWRWNQSYKTICNWPIEKFKIQVGEVANLEWRDKRSVLEDLRAVHPDYAAMSPNWVELFE